GWRGKRLVRIVRQDGLPSARQTPGDHELIATPLTGAHAHRVLHPRETLELLDEGGANFQGLLIEEGVVRHRAIRPHERSPDTALNSGPASIRIRHRGSLVERRDPIHILEK